MLTRTLVVALAIAVSSLCASGQVNAGEQAVGGSPFNMIGNVSGTGSQLDQVNLTNGALHVGIPLVRLKGIGIDTEIDYDWNTLDVSSWDFIQFQPSRIGFRRSGTIEWPQAQQIPVGPNGVEDDPFDTSDPGCDDDDDSCCPPSASDCGDCPNDDGPGCGGAEVIKPNSTSDYNDITNVPFVSTDGNGGTLKQPIIVLLPEGYGPSESTNMYSTDGSYMKSIPGAGVIYPDGVKTMGTRDQPDNGGRPAAGIILEDTVGNKISCDAGNFPDGFQSGINIQTGTQTCIDTHNRSITFGLDSFSNVVDIAYPGYSGTIEHVSIQYVALPIVQVYGIMAPSRITMPDGSHFDFSYSSIGGVPQISKLGLPSGGYIAYVYDAESDTARIKERHVSSDGTALSESIYGYAYGGVSICTDTSITYNPWTSVTGPTGAVEKYTHPNGRIDFVDYTLTDVSGHLLQSKHKDWESNEGAGEFSKGTLRCAPHNPRPHDEIDTDDAGNTRVTMYSYDVNNNVTGTTVSHNFNPFVSDVLKRTQSTYVDATLGSITGVSYFNVNILRLPLSTSTTGVGGNSSSSTFLYDEPAYSPNATAGKVTSTFKTLDSSGTVATSHTRYESHGIAYESIDPLNTVTHLAIDSTSLLPTSITSGYQSGLDQVSVLSVDSSTALLTSIKNSNDIASGGLGKRFSYDADNRVREIDYPDGSFETSDLTYGSSYPFAKITAQHSSSGNPLVTVTTMDGLMRESSKLSPDSSTVETGYDALGRTSDQTNPHTGTANSTDGSVHMVFDDLGRKLSETHRAKQNGSYVDVSTRTWSPSGLVTTMTDEVGHQHVQTLDILGQLVSVQEPAASGTGLGALTTYGYDSLGNLTSVTQAGVNGEAPRVRLFQYDQASRLISSCNPELLAVNQACDGYHWSEHYSYFANGDIYQKTDARGVTTTYSYDALHRLLSKTYTNAPAGSLTSCYSYGTATNGIGLLGAEWTQAGNVACPAQMPNVGYQSARVIVTYDLMGRVKDEKQCFFGACIQGTSGFEFNYAYDPAGNQSTKSDGIGQLSWFDSFDSAGRLLAVDTISVLPYPVPTTRLFTANGYGPGGLLTQWGLGLVGAYPALLATKRYDFEMRPTSEEYQH